MYPINDFRVVGGSPQMNAKMMSYGNSCPNGVCSNGSCTRRTAEKKTWQKPMWELLHALAARYDPSRRDKDPFWVMWINMPTLIPCFDPCQKEWVKMTKNLSIRDYIGKSNVDLLKLTVDLHNNVNTRLGKPQMTWEEAQKMYL